ncbi:hypothetical protein GS483_19640 [Rhodococcus hoagii]|nr:hypothetical protein [Prescottella equi]
MAYVKQTWNNGADGNTPQSADRYNHMEQGIFDAARTADAAAPKSRRLTAGTGLSGGGDLTADRSFAVQYGTAAGTACAGNDARLSDQRVPRDGSVTATKIPQKTITIQHVDDTMLGVLSKANAALDWRVVDAMPAQPDPNIAYLVVPK